MGRLVGVRCLKVTCTIGFENGGSIFKALSHDGRVVGETLHPSDWSCYFLASVKPPLSLAMAAPGTAYSPRIPNDPGPIEVNVVPWWDAAGSEL